MSSFLLLLSVLMALTAVFSIPFACTKHNIQFDVIPLQDARKFNKMKPGMQRDYLINKYLDGYDQKRMKAQGWTIAFKGFNSNMTCMNDFAYREGKTYTCEGEPVLCANGFHACLLPKDVSSYYFDGGNKYHIVFLKDVRHRLNGDSKVCAKTIKIGPRIDHRYITE